MAYFSGETMGAHLGVYGECHVEHSRSGRESYEVAFRREHVYFRSKEVQLYCVEEINGVGFGICENILHGVHP